MVVVKTRHWLHYELIEKQHSESFSNLIMNLTIIGSIDRKAFFITVKQMSILKYICAKSKFSNIFIVLKRDFMKINENEKGKYQ